MEKPDSNRTKRARWGSP